MGGFHCPAGFLARLTSPFFAIPVLRNFPSGLIISEILAAKLGETLAEFAPEYRDREEMSSSPAPSRKENQPRAAAPREGQAIVGRPISQEALRRISDFHIRYLRGVPNGWCVVMKECDLTGLDFRGLNFSQGHFIGCDFAGANLEDAVFKGTNLFGAGFDDANLTRTNFARADLRGARFENAELSGAELAGADLRRGSVIKRGTDAPSGRENSSFRGAKLLGTNMSECKLQGADFEGADISGATLQGADLRGASFNGAELTGVSLAGANLSEADFRRAVMDESTANNGDMMLAEKPRRAPGPERLAKILSAHMLWIQSDEAKGERADFSRMDMSRMDFAGAILAGADFHEAILADTNFERAFLAAADLRETVLKRANLRNADLRGADLRGADLTEAAQEGAKLGDLTGTALSTRR